MVPAIFNLACRGRWAHELEVSPFPAVLYPVVSFLVQLVGCPVDCKMSGQRRGERNERRLR